MSCNIFIGYPFCDCEKSKMTQVGRSDRTKNLMALLTVLVGVVVGYLIIDDAARSTEPVRPAMNEVAGQVKVGVETTSSPPAPVLVAPEPVVVPRPAVTSSPVGILKPENATSDREPTATDTRAMAHPDAYASEPQATNHAAELVTTLDRQIEQAPPAATFQAGEGGANGAAAESDDRLVLSARDTTIVARRYVDEVPASGPDKKGLKLATRFASATRIVPFAFNRVGMGPEGEAAVRELVPIAMKAEKVHVRGRTDAKGAFEINKRVALERAYTVRDKFVAAGVPSEKLGISYCTECFIATNETGAGRRANRRVDVEFIMPAEDIEAMPDTTYAKPLPESAGTLSFARSLGSLERGESN